MAVVIVRHGERMDYADKSWLAAQQEAGRPWDPPLTDSGKDQARQCGRRLKKLPAEHNLPVPTRVYCSPFTRCVETAEGIADTCGVGTVCIEDALVEDLCEDWYRAWGLPDSDGTWRGPVHRRTAPVDKEDLHPMAFQECESLMHAPSFMHDNVSKMVDINYTPTWSLKGQGLCWGRFETHDSVTARALNALQTLHQQHPTETIVLVTHGGPLTLLFNAMRAKEDSPCPHAGYTATVCVKPNGRGGWDYPIPCDNNHLDAALRVLVADRRRLGADRQPDGGARHAAARGSQSDDGVQRRQGRQRWRGSASGQDEARARKGADPGGG